MPASNNLPLRNVDTNNQVIHPNNDRTSHFRQIMMHGIKTSFSAVSTAWQYIIAKLPNTYISSPAEELDTSLNNNIDAQNTSEQPEELELSSDNHNNLIQRVFVQSYNTTSDQLQAAWQYIDQQSTALYSFLNNTNDVPQTSQTISISTEPDQIDISSLFSNDNNNNWIRTLEQSYNTAKDQFHEVWQYVTSTLHSREEKFLDFTSSVIEQYVKNGTLYESSYELSFRVLEFSTLFLPIFFTLYDINNDPSCVQMLLQATYGFMCATNAISIADNIEKLKYLKAGEISLISTAIYAVTHYYRLPSPLRLPFNLYVARNQWTSYRPMLTVCPNTPPLTSSTLIKNYIQTYGHTIPLRTFIAECNNANFHSTFSNFTAIFSAHFLWYMKNRHRVNVTDQVSEQSNLTIADITEQNVPDDDSQKTSCQNIASSNILDPPTTEENIDQQSLSTSQDNLPQTSSDALDNNNSDAQKPDSIQSDSSLNIANLPTEEQQQISDMPSVYSFCAAHTKSCILGEQITPEDEENHSLPDVLWQYAKSKITGNNNIANNALQKFQEFLKYILNIEDSQEVIATWDPEENSNFELCSQSYQDQINALNNQRLTDSNNSLKISILMVTQALMEAHVTKSEAPIHYLFSIISRDIADNLLNQFLREKVFKNHVITLEDIAETITQWMEGDKDINQLILIAPYIIYLQLKPHVIKILQQENSSETSQENLQHLQEKILLIWDEFLHVIVDIDWKEPNLMTKFQSTCKKLFQYAREKCIDDMNKFIAKNAANITKQVEEMASDLTDEHKLKEIIFKNSANIQKINKFIQQTELAIMILMILTILTIFGIIAFINALSLIILIGFAISFIIMTIVCYDIYQQGKPKKDNQELAQMSKNINDIIYNVLGKDVASKFANDIHDIPQQINVLLKNANKKVKNIELIVKFFLTTVISAVIISILPLVMPWLWAVILLILMIPAFMIFIFGFTNLSHSMHFLIHDPELINIDLDKPISKDLIRKCYALLNHISKNTDNNPAMLDSIQHDTLRQIFDLNKSTHEVLYASLKTIYSTEYFLKITGIFLIAIMSLILAVTISYLALIFIIAAVFLFGKEIYQKYTQKDQIKIVPNNKIDIHELLKKRAKVLHFLTPDDQKTINQYINIFYHTYQELNNNNQAIEEKTITLVSLSILIATCIIGILLIVIIPSMITSILVPLVITILTISINIPWLWGIWNKKLSKKEQENIQYIIANNQELTQEEKNILSSYQHWSYEYKNFWRAIIINDIKTLTRREIANLKGLYNAITTGDIELMKSLTIDITRLLDVRKIDSGGKSKQKNGNANTNIAHDTNVQNGPSGDNLNHKDSTNDDLDLEINNAQNLNNDNPHNTSDTNSTPHSNININPGNDGQKLTANNFSHVI